MRLTWQMDNYTVLVKDVSSYIIDDIHCLCFTVDKRDKNYGNYLNGKMWLSADEEDYYTLTKESWEWIRKQLSKIPK